IAGHRTTYLAPFRHIDALHRGNRILLNMPYAQLTYSVIGQRIVRPTNVQAAVANVGYTRLVLSACTPLFSAEKRILVYGRLVRIVPVGAARELPGGALVQPIQTPQPSAARPPQARAMCSASVAIPSEMSIIAWTPAAASARPSARRGRGHRARSSSA